MKLMAFVIFEIMIGPAVEAGQKSDRCLEVYVRDSAQISTLVLARAKGLASKMFAAIGVQINWHNGVPSVSSSKSAIAIELTTKTPETLMPGAMAYALPIEGIHIQIFYDRIEETPSPTGLLGHVLVHEITHILQGISRHSDTGVMKAHWAPEDYYTMRYKTLPFAPEDVDLIYRGLGTPSVGGVTCASKSLTNARTKPTER